MECGVATNRQREILPLQASWIWGFKIWALLEVARPFLAVISFWALVPSYKDGPKCFRFEIQR